MSRIGTRMSAILAKVKKNDGATFTAKDKGAIYRLHAIGLVDVAETAHAEFGPSGRLVNSSRYCVTLRRDPR